ncbi:MAG TPA: lipoyl(octanoyl) transferase LipB [Oligoflexia bacterium]|nr:lipoyl(octanoyl) transferase LipB [Oligoflexia bacterium]HMP47105.1 lipoyl(octanoyl) transferase LipB [Oligoflexia bacterium]
MLARNKFHNNLKNGGLIVLLAEHDPCITLGKRISLESQSGEFLAKCKSRDLNIIETDRGGLITYHGPGQLMIYPLMSLLHYGISVRFFVMAVLSTVVNVLKLVGVNAYVDQLMQGVWVKVDSAPRKIASAGFRIVRGISDHGVCLYVNKIADDFSFFLPCGSSPHSLISIHEYLNEGVSFDLIREVFRDRFSEYLFSEIRSSM